MMAATSEARRLTEAHRLAQARLGAQTVQQMRVIWPLLDPADPVRWLRAARIVVSGQRRVSARLAANYVSTFKTLELGTTASAPPLILAETAPAAAVTTSMIVTGPRALEAARRRGVQVARALDVAEARSSASAMRHVLNGGRETILETIAADRQARGWRRVTSGSACEFCSMLARRGAVYGAESVSFHAHDACGCSAEPVFRD
jgi:hypothetical protein